MSSSGRLQHYVPIKIIISPDSQFAYRVAA
jgi:hypothetical protein